MFIIKYFKNPRSTRKIGIMKNLRGHSCFCEKLNVAYFAGFKPVWQYWTDNLSDDRKISYLFAQSNISDYREKYQIFRWVFYASMEFNKFLWRN